DVGGAVGIEHDDVPAGQVVAVVALEAGAGRVAEVVEVVDGLGAVGVLVVAGDGVDPGGDVGHRSPRRAVALLVVEEVAGGVGAVAQHGHGRFGFLGQEGGR